jgi:hypothetical protein
MVEYKAQQYWNKINIFFKDLTQVCIVVVVVFDPEVTVGYNN